MKATITGSIIGNLLLVRGLSIPGRWITPREQTTAGRVMGVGATLSSAIACEALIIPTLFFLYQAHPTAAEVRSIVNLSEEISVVLIVLYLLSLVFTLRTHRHLTTGADERRRSCAPIDAVVWGTGKAVGVLLAATVGWR